MTTAFIDHGSSMIIQTGGEIAALAARDIGSDLILSCYNPITRTLGMIRNPVPATLPQFIHGVMNPHDPDDPPVLQVRIMGGDLSDISRSIATDILGALLDVDAGRNVIDIVSSTLHGQTCPASVRITVFDGHIQEM